MNRRAALQGYVVGLLAVDATAAFDVAIAEPPSPLRDDLLEKVIYSADKLGLSKVREFSARIEDPAQRQRFAFRAFSLMSDRTSPECLEWIKEQVGVAKDVNEMEMWGGAVGNALAASNPADAASWAATLSNDPERDIFSAIVDRWIARDRAGFEEWIKTNAATLDPNAAEKASAEVSRRLKDDPTHLAQFSDSLPSGTLKDSINFQVALISAEKGNLQSLITAYQSVEAGDTKGDLRKQLVKALVASNPSIGAEWVANQQEGGSREAAIAELASQWGERDPRAAGWIESMASGRERDTALREYASQVVFADPVVAGNWVQQVQDEALRSEAAKRVFNIWTLEDPVAARLWVRQVPGVDESWKAQVLRTAL